MTAFEKWITERFGGPNARSGLTRYTEALIESLGIVSPPVALTKIAENLGLDPRPKYRKMLNPGSLQLVNGKLKMFLEGVAPKVGTPRHRRMRFTYAHELAHCLFFDLSSMPNRRLAPIGAEKTEETLCNIVASHMLLPNSLVKKYISESQEPSIALAKTLADAFHVSIMATSIAFERFFCNTPLNKVYILSQFERGKNGFGIKKPRCVVCLVPQVLQNARIQFLRPFQSIDHINSRNRLTGKREVAWSLHGLYQSNHFCGTPIELECEESLLLGPKCDIQAEAHSRHVVLGKGRYIWSEIDLHI